MAVVSHAQSRTAPADARSIPIVTWLSRKNRGWYLLGYIILAVMTLWTVFPFYWQLATSFRLDVDLYSSSLSLIPHSLTLEHYAHVLGGSSPFTTQFAQQRHARSGGHARVDLPRLARRVRAQSVALLRAHHAWRAGWCTPIWHPAS